MVEREDASAWSCITSDVEDPANLYADVLGVSYSYDSNVIHHSQLRPGDAILLRGDRELLGFGLIERIDSASGTKTMIRCPVCNRAGQKPRSRSLPAYRCFSCHAEFDVPRRTQDPITRFTAWYGPSFVPFAPGIPRSAIDPLYVEGDRQNAIRRLDPSRLLSFAGQVARTDAVDLIRHMNDGEGVSLGGFAEAMVRRRRGQEGFRRRLLTRFGYSCALSGSQPPEVLDAAHLYPYARSGVHDDRSGLLLRADLHRLFDAFLLSVDESAWVSRVAPRVVDAYPHLSSFDGAPLRLEVSDRPRGDLLRSHRLEAQDRWQRAEPLQVLDAANKVLMAEHSGPGRALQGRGSAERHR